MVNAGKKSRSWRNFIRDLPGKRADYILLFLVSFDILLLIALDWYGKFLIEEVTLSIIAFDFAVIAIWLFELFLRFRRSANRIDFVKTHWYEFVGLTPIPGFRLLLLLRAAKLAIAFYKLGRSEQRFSRLITRDITFRFRDIIVDTIADAVFLQSLERVEEVMSRLDYGKVASQAFEQKKSELEEIVTRSLAQKSMVGELAKIPMMGSFVNRLGKDVTSVITEVMETEAVGNIFKEIVQQILHDMSDRVKVLDVERLTRQEIEMKKALHLPEDNAEDTPYFNKG